jgi:predicted metalloendopeptidase
MSPSAVNAYYDASMNEMVFPAGILQPPFFQRTAGRAENFGGIGMVMGHELTHGFDDEGRKFDGAGNLREWWTPAVGEAFEERAKCVVAQYDAYKVEGLALNGKLTLGENIADIGGLEMAHRAFEKAAGNEPDTAGFSAEQRFFLAFAQSWCANVRPPYARMLVTVDPHAPPRFRVNGSVANQPAFQRAFSCKAGAPMAPEKRCSVW